MAELIIAAIRGEAAADSHFLTDPIPDPGAVDGLIFSGGVAEYVYGTETQGFR